MSHVFLVTGSSRGLGRAIVTAALDAGHQVVATARRPGDLDDVVNTYGDRVRAVTHDVSDPAAARAAVATALEAFGRLDVVVANAGYADLAAVEDVTEDAFRAQIDTNLFGVVHTIKAALPGLREQGSGHLIAVSSVGGRMATPGLSAYQTAKWAVGGFMSVLAAETAPLGLKVTVVEPGGMRTDWAGSSMTVPPISEPYQQTVGASSAMHDSLRSTSVSDPAKVADLVLRIAASDQPPLRLLVGGDAFRYGTAAGRALAAQDEKWRAWSESTDADDVTESDGDPMATLQAR